MWDPLVGQPHGNGVGPHPLINVHVEDAADDLRLLFNHIEPAVISDAVSVGDAAGGHASLLAVPRLPRVDRSRKLSNSILPMAAMSPKVFMSMASMTASSRNLVCLDDLHEAAAGYMPY